MPSFFPPNRFSQMKPCLPTYLPVLGKGENSDWKYGCVSRWIGDVNTTHSMVLAYPKYVLEGTIVCYRYAVNIGCVWLTMDDNKMHLLIASYHYVSAGCSMSVEEQWCAICSDPSATDSFPQVCSLAQSTRARSTLVDCHRTPGYLYQEYTSTRVSISPSTRVSISPSTRVSISPSTRVSISPSTSVSISGVHCPPGCLYHHPPGLAQLLLWK